MIPFYYDDFSTVDPESDDVKDIEQDMLAGTDIHGTSACPSPPEQDLEEEDKQLAKGQSPDTTSSELTALLLCIICSDELNLSRAYVLCESKHATCNSCFDRYVSMEVAKGRQINMLAAEAATAEAAQDDLKLRRLCGSIVCPLAGPGGCQSTAAFADRAIALHVSEEVFGDYVEGRARLPAAKTVQEALQKGAEMRSLFPNARMCGRCSYGPVEDRPGSCNDLETHHGEVMFPSGNERRGVRIDNACPKCGWFKRYFSDWPMWDGGLGYSVADPLATGAAGDHTESQLTNDERAEEERLRRARREEELRAFRAEREARRPFGFEEFFQEVMHGEMTDGPILIDYAPRPRPDNGRQAQVYGRAVRHLRLQDPEDPTLAWHRARQQHQELQARRAREEREARERQEHLAMMAEWVREEREREEREEAEQVQRALQELEARQQRQQQQRRQNRRVEATGAGREALAAAMFGQAAAAPPPQAGRFTRRREMRQRG